MYIDRDPSDTFPNGVERACPKPTSLKSWSDLHADTAEIPWRAIHASISIGLVCDYSSAYHIISHKFPYLTKCRQRDDGNGPTPPMEFKPISLPPSQPPQQPYKRARLALDRESRTVHRRETAKPRLAMGMRQRY